MNYGPTWGFLKSNLVSCDAPDAFEMKLSEHEAQAGAISKETGDSLPDCPVSWQPALLYPVATTHHCLSKAGTCDFTTCQLSKAILEKFLYIL